MNKNVADSVTPEHYKKEPDFSCENFGRKTPRLTFKNAPRYHSTLQKLLGEMDKTSLKIQSCGIAGRRVDCMEDGTFNRSHTRYIPVMCDRRTCPECALKDMQDRLEQFKGIGDIAFSYSRKADWRVRFWTLTIKSAPYGADLRPYFQGLKKSLDSLWRALFGDNAQRHSEYGEKLKNAGGVFFLEVQGGWNPHLHGLVLSPFVRVETVRKIWGDIVKKNGLSGDRIHIEEPYKKIGKGLKAPCVSLDDYRSALFEIVQYPIHPDKNGRHDQVLMAHVEAGLKGLRRYFCKGDWYNKFERPEHRALCADCAEDFLNRPDYQKICKECMSYSGDNEQGCGKCLATFTHDDIYDDFSKATIQEFFTEDEKGIQNWEKFGYHFPKQSLRELQRERFGNVPSADSLKEK